MTSKKADIAKILADLWLLPPIAALKQFFFKFLTIGIIQVL